MFSAFPFHNEGARRESIWNAGVTEDELVHNTHTPAPTPFFFPLKVTITLFKYFIMFKHLTYSSFGEEHTTTIQKPRSYYSSYNKLIFWGKKFHLEYTNQRKNYPTNFIAQAFI